METNGTRRFYKVKLRLDHSPAHTWIAVKAGSEGEAAVIADERCTGTPFRIGDNSAVEITEEEYRGILIGASYRKP